MIPELGHLALILALLLGVLALVWTGCGGSDDGGCDVPATTGIGVVLTALVLRIASAYCVRRRTKG